MTTKRRMKTMVATTAGVLAVGVVAGAQNLRVRGTTTSDGASYLATTSGSVGIGTATIEPNSKAHIYNAAGGTGVEIQTAAASSWVRQRFVTPTRTYGWFLEGGNNSGAPTNSLGLFDYTANAFRMIIDANGQVGIGVWAPAYKLDVAGSANVTGGLHSTGGGTDNWYPYTDGNTYIRGQAILDNGAFVNGAAGQQLVINGNQIWKSNTTGDKTLYFQFSGPGNVSLAQGGGNVGIGTTTPAAKLDVASGAVYFPGAGGGNGWQTHFNYTGGGGPAGNYIRGNTFIADAGGMVGIGTTSPTAKLHVLDTGGGMVLFQNGYGYVSMGAMNAGFVHNYTDRPAYYFNKPVYCDGGCLTYSAREKKEDIKYLTPEEEQKILDDVKALKMATFRYKGQDADKNQHLGVMADESPAIILNKEKNAVQLYDYTSLAVTAVKAQQARIEQLERKIEALEAQRR